jgi:hypothetical protein
MASSDTEPKIISFANEYTQNNLVRDYIRCLAKNRDGWDQERVAWLDQMNVFIGANPTPSPTQIQK